MASVLNRQGHGRLPKLEPRPPVERYERKHHKDLSHIGIKKLAPVCKVGHRITGRRQLDQSAGVGYVSV